MAALLELVENSTKGDPMKPLTWTTKSLRRLADELAAQGRNAGRDTVARVGRCKVTRTSARARFWEAPAPRTERARWGCRQV